jgi:hypothetical protein
MDPDQPDEPEQPGAPDQPDEPDQPGDTKVHDDDDSSSKWVCIGCGTSVPEDDICKYVIRPVVVCCADRDCTYRWKVY